MSAEGVRLDKWLWAARFFKTRRLAVEAIGGGKVQVAGVRAKPAKMVRVGDRVCVHKAPFEYEVIVRGLSEQRGPAKLAVELYEETPESIARAARLREQLKLDAAGKLHTKGKPDKRERRQLQDFKKERGG